MARALLRDQHTDKGGNALAAHTIAIYQPSLLTAVSDTLYSSRTGSTTVSASGITTDANGYFEAWAETPGTHIPGVVRIYCTTSGCSSDKDYMYFASAAITPTNGTMDYLIFMDTDQSIYVAEAQMLGFSSYTHATDVGSVINSALGGANPASGFLSRGVHLCSTAMTPGAGSSLFGVGDVDEGATGTKGSVIKANTGFTGNLMTLHASGAVSLCGIQLDAFSRGAKALVIAGAGGIVWNCGIKGGTSISLDITGARADIRDCQISGTSAGTSFNCTTSDGIFAGNRIKNGLTVLKTSGGFGQYIGNHITGDENTTANIWITGGQNQFVSNYIDGNSGGPLLKIVPASATTVTHTEIRANKFWRPGSNPTGGSALSAIYIDTSTANCEATTIQGNTFLTSNVNGYKYALEFSSATPAVNAPATIFQNNVCAEMNTGAMWSALPDFYDNNIMMTKDAVTLKRDKNRGVFSGVTGATVTHGLVTTPVVVLLTPSANGQDPFPNALGATTFAVNFAGGGTQTIYWEAFV